MHFLSAQAAARAAAAGKATPKDVQAEIRQQLKKDGAEPPVRLRDLFRRHG